MDRWTDGKRNGAGWKGMERDGESTVGWMKDEGVEGGMARTERQMDG